MIVVALQFIIQTAFLLIAVVDFTTRMFRLDEVRIIGSLRWIIEKILEIAH